MFDQTWPLDRVYGSNKELQNMKEYHSSKYIIVKYINEQRTNSIFSDKIQGIDNRKIYEKL